MNTKIKPGYVWLQGYGWQKGKPAGEIKLGDTLMWNYGYMSKVLEIVKETPKTIIVKTHGETGYIGERRMLKNRLVAITEKGEIWK